MSKLDHIGQVKSLKEAYPYLDHLQGYHKERLGSCEEELKKLRSFKEEYENLHSKLLTLADKTTHEVKVPLGPLAFMPGRLIHTNEVLVLLGDNWFAERSSKQAAEIAARRIEDCSRKILACETALKAHKNWIDQSSHLLEEGDSSGQVEICELLSEEDYQKEKGGRKRLRGRRDQEASPQEPRNKYTKTPDKKTFDDLMKRLDELEMEESTKDELANLGMDTSEEMHVDEAADKSDQVDKLDETMDEDVDVSNALIRKVKQVESVLRKSVSHSHEEDSDDDSPMELDPLFLELSNRRRVSWAEKSLQTIIPDEKAPDVVHIQYESSHNLSSETVEEASEEDSLEESPVTEMLSFDDSCVERKPPSAPPESETVIKSPADIHSVFNPSPREVEEIPRSILKQPSREDGLIALFRDQGNVSFKETDKPPPPPPPPPPPAAASVAGQSQAFSYEVKVNEGNQSQGDWVQPSSDKRKVSKFKLDRSKMA